MRLIYKPAGYILTELERCTVKGKNDATTAAESLTVEANDLSRGKRPGINYHQRRFSGVDRVISHVL